MQQLRVVDLARTMGISSAELIFRLRSIGVSVASEDDSLDLATVKSIITGETLQRRPKEVIVRSEPREEEPPATARDRLVTRRRRKTIKTETEIKEVLTERTAAAGEAPSEEPVAPAAEVTAPGAEAEVEAAEAAAQEAEVVAETLEEVAEPGAEEEVAEEAAEGTEPAVAAEPVEAGAEPGEAAEPSGQPSEAEEEVKPTPEITEEELTTARTEKVEEPKRVRPRRARTPLEQTLRELSPDEIRQRLAAQRQTEKARPAESPAAARAGKKVKAAADAREIRELLTKFEEQKLKGQQEAAAAPAGKPGPRPAAQRTGRKVRRRGDQAEAEKSVAPPQLQSVQFRDGVAPTGPIILSEMVTPRELAEKLNVTAKDLLAMLIRKGVMVTTNQSVPHELAEQVCADLGIDAMVASAEEVAEYQRVESAEVSGPLVPRSPVVTVMGHVDHGKTSLLDAIRSTRVADQEAGGITQHIGASRIETPDGRTVVFVDTPGHEAFTQMRARGAQVTDIVVLVVAADDGVMPQTIEAINHARAAKVPIIVAINKIDKPNADVDRVKHKLSDHGVLIDEWGGDVPVVQVSAKQRQGITELLDMILLVAEMRDLKASTEGFGRGVVLEARKEKGRGTVATVLVQQGSLKVGDFFFCGSTWGRIRAISDENGARLDQAGPAEPVEIMGFEDVPGAGDVLQGVEGEANALEVASYRSQRAKEEGLLATRKVSLENLFETISESETKQLNVVIKADVQGSVEVLHDTLVSLSTDKVKIAVLHGSVGAISTNDVMLAAASNAIIVGFGVRPERTARDLAETEKVDIRLYTVIYDLVDDVKKAMVGLLEPVYREEELGHAEVREVFHITKMGMVAGTHVTDGVITRTAKIRLLRDNIVIWEGNIASLKRFKDDASEVRQGFECGIALERFQDVKKGDVIEAFRMVEMTPEL